MSIKLQKLSNRGILGEGKGKSDSLNENSRVSCPLDNQMTVLGMIGGKVIRLFTNQSFFK